MTSLDLCMIWTIFRLLGIIRKIRPILELQNLGEKVLPEPAFRLAFIYNWPSSDCCNRGILSTSTTSEILRPYLYNTSISGTAELSFQINMHRLIMIYLPYMYLGWLKCINLIRNKRSADGKREVSECSMKWSLCRSIR